MNSYIVLKLGKEKLRTNIKKNKEEPYFGEWFLFEWYTSLRELQRTSIWLAVMEIKCCATPPHLLGASTIDLGAIWAQPNHQVFHKWSQLYNPHQHEAGSMGFLKVDISITCRGNVTVMPVTAQYPMDKSTPSVSLEQQPALYQVTVFSAYGLADGVRTRSQGDRPPSTYVKVSFGGLSGKTAIQYRNRDPAYCEQISIAESFPSPYQVVRFEVFAGEPFNKVLASTELRLEQISHDGENGFVPTFGPSLIHMYGGISSGMEMSGEDGPFHKGALLVALKTVVPYYQQNLRSTNVEPVTPIHLNDLWTYEDFFVFCTVLNVSMLDRKIIGKSCGVAITIGEVPCENEGNQDFLMVMKELQSRKLHYTGSLRVTPTNAACSHLEFSNSFPVLQMAARLPDLRFKVFMSNMVRTITVDLENVLSSLEKKLTRVHFNLIDLTEELRNAVNNTSSQIRTFLDVFDQKQNLEGSKSYKSELECKQRTLQRDELEKIYQQITKKVKSDSVNLMQLATGKRADFIDLTKKEFKSLLIEAKTLTQRIGSLIFEARESWPDIVIWLLGGASRVAYCKLSLGDIIFSDVLEQRGVQCGLINTMFFKPIKCPKHFNALGVSCTCIAGKIEMQIWMGVYDQMDLFESCLPEGYMLKNKGFLKSVRTTTTMLHCRVFINRAKLFKVASSSPLCLFVRIHAFNSIKDTEVESNTLNPTWNAVLTMQSMQLISESRLMSNPPSIIVEVLNIDLLGKTDIIGRLELKPTTIDTRNYYESAPKLQWFKILHGIEHIGQILMSGEILLIPETLVKSTFYCAVDETRNENLAAQKASENLDDKIPPCLMPKSVTYKMDVYWWGLRDVSISKKPCVVIEIEDLVIKSDIITDNLPNCNFPNGRTSYTFEAPITELECPLIIKLCDCSTFGRTFPVGTKFIKNPNKYLVDWIPKFNREESIRSVSILSSNFVHVSDSLYIKKSPKLAKDSTEYSKNVIGSNIFQMSTKILSWKNMFHRKKCDEECVLIPISGNEKENVDCQTANNSCSSERQDWWMRFFTSLKEGTNENSNLVKIKIYDSELESQFDFFKFKDWCHSFNIYRGKKSGISERDANLKCGVFKAGIAIYKWPPPFNSAVVNCNGVDLTDGYFEDLPLNESEKYLIRIYIVRGLNLTHNFNGGFNPYFVINCGSKQYEGNKSSESNHVNPVFGKLTEFECNLPQDYLLTVSLALSPDDLIGCTTIDLEDRIYSKHRARVGLAPEYKVTGSTKWRDCVKPSVILDEICIKNHIPPPLFRDNTVIFNEIQYKNSDYTSETYASASECKENICLEILKKWHTLPICGYRLVPEHVETRKLFSPGKPGIEKMILKEQGVFTEEEEHFPPVLIIQIKDYDAVSDLDYLGMICLDLNSIPKGSMNEEQSNLYTMDSLRINLFKNKSVHGWWPSKYIDRNTGTAKFAGFVELEMDLMPKEIALLMPVSSPLAIPSKHTQYHCPNEPPQPETTSNRFDIEYAIIRVIVVLAIILTFYWGLIIIY